MSASLRHQMSGDQNFRSFADQLPVGVFRVSADLRRLFVNRSLADFIGIAAGDLPTDRLGASRLPIQVRRQLLTTVREVIKAGDTLELEFALPGDEGARSLQFRLSPEREADGEISHVVGVALDVTDRRRVEEKLRRQSVIDRLTGLYNRRGFLLLAEQEQRSLRRSGRPAALFVVEVDGLKQINDAHGDDEAEAVLVAVAELLRQAFRCADIVARLDGGEFVVLASDCEDREVMRRRLTSHLEEYNLMFPRPYAFAVNVGLAEIDPDAREPVEAQIALASERLREQRRFQPS